MSSIATPPPPELHLLDILSNDCKLAAVTDKIDELAVKYTNNLTAIIDR